MPNRTEWLRLCHERLWINLLAHYRLSEKYERRGRFYTKLNILFAISVLFFSNSKILDSLTGGNHYGVVISVAGLGTVLTAALQYINRYEERAALHKLAGSEYSILRREGEILLSEPSVSDDAV